jgi:hypothetical protein
LAQPGSLVWRLGGDVQEVRMNRLIARSARPAAFLVGALLVAASFSAAGSAVATSQLSASSSSSSQRYALAVSRFGHISIWGQVNRTPGDPPPPPFSFISLSDVYCTSASNCWAVGVSQKFIDGTGLNQMLHWDGKKWHSFPVPNPGGTGPTAYNTLFSVRCAAARDCWAVGYYSKSSEAAELDEALHWNGKKWYSVPTPTPAGILGGDVNELYDVTCATSANCWAVGKYGTSGTTGTAANQALHWNGKRWSLVSVPQPAGTGTDAINQLEDVRCPLAASCLAVGDYGSSGSKEIGLNEALRWNGKKWFKVSTPDPAGTHAGHYNFLSSLGCSSSNSCWAAGSDGTYATDTSLNEILHWNGKKWFTATTPDPDGTGAGAGNYLYWDTCVSSSECWAFGDHGHISNNVGAVLNQVLRWNGTRWSEVHVPDPGGTGNNDLNVLAGARCTSAANCWAVGYIITKKGYIDQILHWNGKKWSIAMT